MARGARRVSACRPAGSSVSRRPLAASAQETINYAQRQRARHRSAGRGRARRAGRRRARPRPTSTRDAVTDAEGRFRFPYLRVGPYEIAVRLPGFADATRRLDAHRRLGVRAADRARGRRPSTRASRSPATATVLEAARSQIAGTVSQTEVANLPLNGRNFLDLALLVPGVSPTNVGSTQLFAETSAVPGRRASRSAASATSRTTSSSTACRPTTTPRG